MLNHTYMHGYNSINFTDIYLKFGVEVAEIDAQNKL